MTLSFYLGLFLAEVFSLFSIGNNLSVFLNDEVWWFKLPFVVFCIAVIEVWMAKRLLRGGTKRDVGKTLLLSHVPWVLNWTWPWLSGLALPALPVVNNPNINVLKLQAFLGLMLLSHFFLFSVLLLWRMRRDQKAVAKRFGLVSIFFFIVAASWTSAVCDLSGDEPHYLLMAYSL